MRGITQLTTESTMQLNSSEAILNRNSYQSSIPPRGPITQNSLDSENWDIHLIRSEKPISKRKFYIAIVIGIILVLAIAAGLTAFAIIRNQQKEARESKFKNSVRPPRDYPTNYTITPDSRLKKSFWGLTYTPVNAQFPNCRVSYDDVVEDIKLLSQLTDRIRLYGMDCNQSHFTLKAIENLKIPMKVVLTIWVDDNDETYKRQYNSFFDAINKFGSDRILAVSVGNEALFRKEITTSELSARIIDVRQKLKAMGITIPVTTSEIGSLFTSELIAVTDRPMPNIHPFFAGVTPEQASSWTLKYFDENIAKKSRNPSIISEVGWPTQGDAEKTSVPSVQGLQTVVDDFVCNANSLGYRYFFFEMFDESWKIIFNVRETSWGLFTPDRQLKVQIPDCQVADISF